MTAVGTTDVAGPFVHPAFFYQDDDDYVAGTLPFVLKGLAGSEPVAVAVPTPRLRLLRAALGADADQVRMLDMTEVGRNPGRIIPTVLRAFADRFPDQHVRIIGEPIWSGRSAAEYPACAQHEALINYSFAGRRVTVLCPYDVVGLPERILADAARTHPLLADGASSRPSASYAPGDVIAAHNVALPRPAGATDLPISVTGLAELRHTIGEFGQRHGLSERRAYELMLAASELMANSVQYAPGPATVSLGTTAAGMPAEVVCQVRDTGHIADPLAGRRPAPHYQPGGRGLLLVNQLADLVRVYTARPARPSRSAFARSGSSRGLAGHPGGHVAGVS